MFYSKKIFYMHFACFAILLFIKATRSTFDHNSQGVLTGDGGQLNLVDQQGDHIIFGTLGADGVTTTFFYHHLPTQTEAFLGCPTSQAMFVQSYPANTQIDWRILVWTASTSQIVQCTASTRNTTSTGIIAAMFYDKYSGSQLVFQKSATGEILYKYESSTLVNGIDLPNFNVRSVQTTQNGYLFAFGPSTSPNNLLYVINLNAWEIITSRPDIPIYYPSYIKPAISVFGSSMVLCNGWGSEVRNTTYQTLDIITTISMGQITNCLMISENTFLLNHANGTSLVYNISDNSTPTHTFNNYLYSGQLYQYSLGFIGILGKQYSGFFTNITMPSAAAESNSQSNFMEALRMNTRATAQVLLPLSSLRVSFKFVMALSLFMEDLSYYKYHNGINYPSLMTILMEEVSYAKLFKLKPKAFDSLKINNSFWNAEFLNYKYVNYSNSINSAGEGLQVEEQYFAFSSRNFFTFGLVYLIILFLTLRLLRCLFQIPCCQANFILEKLSNMVSERCRLWVFSIMLIDSDFSALSFSSFNQISQPFSLSFESKLSLTFAIIINLIFLIFSLSGFVLLYHYHRKSSVMVLSFGKESKMGMLLETLLIFGNRTLRALCHSNILFTHMDKLVGLIIVDSLIILFCIRMIRHFYYRMGFIVYLTYSVLFLVLDVLLQISYTGSITIARVDNVINMVVIILMALTLLKMFLILFRELKGFCDMFKKKTIIIAPNSEIISSKTGAQETEDKNNGKLDSSNTRKSSSSGSIGGKFVAQMIQRSQRNKAKIKQKQAKTTKDCKIKGRKKKANSKSKNKKQKKLQPLTVVVRAAPPSFANCQYKDSIECDMPQRPIRTGPHHK